MSDDHAAHALSCYGSVINKTPHLDRIANEGMRFDNCFCTNSICSPSRATILTGTYNHVNGVRTLADHLDGESRMTFPKLLGRNGFQTAIIGKWHLGHGGKFDPNGVDYWNILPGQGEYHNPEFIEMGKTRRVKGYVTDLITDSCLDWLERRDPEKPFCLLCHHKAPHDPWEPDDKHRNMFKDIEMPRPKTFYDAYENRASAAAASTQRIEMMNVLFNDNDVPPEGLSIEELKEWNYQKFIKDYLRVIASIDDNTGRLLDYLDKNGLAENTIVVYTSDQGFFLGDHGWCDKRFMYEESLRMPLMIRFPAIIAPGSACARMALNTDFAQTFLDCCGVPTPEIMQGRSMLPLLKGEEPDNWRDSMYYRYWMHLGHFNVCSHYGVRTERYKLIFYYAQSLGCSGTRNESWAPEWELFDLEKDPEEMFSVYDVPEYAPIVAELKRELHRKMAEVGDVPADNEF